MRRFANLNNVAKVAIAATAVMLAVVGITLVSPSSSPSATARPASSPTAASVGVDGRQTVTEKGVRFSFTVAPGGWARFHSISTDKSPAGPISLNRDSGGSQGAEAIIYWTSFPDGDYADPCARVLAPSIGRSAANLAAAVSTAPGTKLVKGPLDVTLGGRPAKHVVLTVRKNVGCEPGFFYKWEDISGGSLWPRTHVGDTIRVWIIAVGGTRLFIAAASNEQASARLKREIKQIVESIRFEANA